MHSFIKKVQLYAKFFYDITDITQFQNSNLSKCFACFENYIIFRFIF